MKVLITGGCGFIGSNFVRWYLAERSDVEVVLLDKLTYAGNLHSLADVLDDARLIFLRGDIADRATVSAAMQGADGVINFAAESHVDRSILNSSPFVRTNVAGTQMLLDVALDLSVSRFLQISTDEVYGSLGPSGRFTEHTPLAPNSPYSASKAAADLLVRAYVHTHAMPALILRSSNAYGPYQFPEKLIPLMITSALAGEPLPVYGDGMHVRDWVHVLDLCSAIASVFAGGRIGEVYNVGGGNELPNIEVVRRILAITGASESLIRLVPDRPGHDRRYAMDHSKLTAELGWKPMRDFDEGLRETVRWYQASSSWLDVLRTGEYMDYFERQYAGRLKAGRAAGENSSRER
jgi:dTDP-glucose 4,6-dehydratase